MSQRETITAQETLVLELDRLRALLTKQPEKAIKDPKACYCLANTISALRNEFELALDMGDNGKDDPDDMTGLGAAYEGEWEAQVLENRKGMRQVPPVPSLHRRGPRR